MKRLRMTASATRSSVRASGAPALVDMEVEVEALRVGAPGRCGRARASVARPARFAEEGDAARGRRRSRATVATTARKAGSSSRGHVDREQSTPPAARCGRASPRAARRRQARRWRSAARGNRDGCGSRRCRGRRRSAARNPCARARRRPTSSPRGPRRHWSSAPMKVPSGFGRRGQIWPLSRWVWMSTKRGRRCRRRDRAQGRSASRLNVPAGHDRGDAPVLDRDVDRGKPFRVRRKPGPSSRG